MQIFMVIILGFAGNCSLARILQRLYVKMLRQGSRGTPAYFPITTTANKSGENTLNHCKLHFRMGYRHTLVGALIALTLAAGPVHAEQTFTFLGTGAQYIGVNLLHDGTVAAGRYQGKLSSAPNANFYIFCTDFTHWINWGQQYSTLSLESSVTDIRQDLNHTINVNHYFYQATSGGEGTPGGIVSAMQTAPNVANQPIDYFRSRTTTDGTYVTGPGNTAGGLNQFSIFERAEAVAYLTDKFLNDLTLTTKQVAGVQLAIWDIIQDGGDGFASGYVQRGSNSTGGDADLALGFARGYETETANRLLIRTYTSGTAKWIQGVRDANNPDPNHPQDFAYVNDNNVHIESVPEPAFYQMSALMGLGGAGLLARRRRNRDPRDC